MARAEQMVPIATAADPFEAKLLAARLGAAGIVWELRGNVDGVYPIGPFQVLVEADAAGAAHDLLVDPLVDRSPGDPAESDAGAAAVGPRFSAVAVIAVLVVVVLFTVARMLAMG